ncbi:MAG: CotH kinase family protein [Clostridia bacterium]|nr:CotH kinase family protein [Clostridia bacterium]
MKRTELLLAMLALAMLTAVVVFAASPYAPVVEPVMEIEAVWAIEDARTESGGPLVTYLENGGAPLGYDAEENTFYCTLGLGQGEGWPEIHLTAPDAKGTRLVFVDDYSYDWCADAIREGYAYQLLCYTDTKFFYTQIVFTGLPIVLMRADAQIGYEDVSASVALSTNEGCSSAGAAVHLRGAGSRFSEKKSYKIDFVHGRNGSGAYAQVPGLGLADDVILLAGVMDESLIRDRLSWAVYAKLADDTESYGPRDTQYAELFINDSYAGVYLMMEPVDDGEELQKRGADAPMDSSVYRTAQIDYAGERPYTENAAREGSIYELYHTPDTAHPFAALEDYLALERMPQDAEYDEAFRQLAAACIDTESMMRYYLFVQAGGMSDNVFNNMYIVAHRQQGGVRYSFAPWDMDLTWGRFKDAQTGEIYNGLFSFPVAERMLRTDAGGAQAILAQLWAGMREAVFNLENMQMMVDEAVSELTDSGAYVRDALRWRGDAYQADGSEILQFAAMRFEALDAEFAAYAAAEGE